MNRLLLSLLILGASSSLALCQQLPIFTQYRNNATVLNPAAVSADYFAYGNNVSFGGTHRKQFVDFNGAPTTQILRGDFFNAEGGSAVNLLAGGHLINDQTGPIGTTGLYGRIGGVFSNDPYFSGISAGLSLGVNQYRIDGSDIRLRDEGDFLLGQQENTIYPDVGFGVFAYTMLDGAGFEKDYLYGGISVPQVMGLDVNVKLDDGSFDTRRTQHIYGFIGLYHFMKGNTFLEPSLWVRYAPNAPVNVDLNLRYQMTESFYLGFGGATSKTVHLESGVLLGPNLGYDSIFRIGYSFDYSFATFGPDAGVTHEINIDYSMPW